MVTTYVAVELVNTGSYWLAFGAALLSGLVLGAVLERTVIRFVEDKPPINEVIVTLGVFLVIQALAAILFGTSTGPSRRRSGCAASRSAGSPSPCPASGSSVARCWS